MEAQCEPIGLGVRPKVVEAWGYDEQAERHHDCLNKNEPNFVSK
jgi:hypothetical protein